MTTTGETTSDKAERHVREGEARVEHQEAILAELLRDGHSGRSVELAKSTLDTLRASLDVARDRLKVMRGIKSVAGVGEPNVHVQVDGTTFAGIYEVVDGTVLLTSADFGDGSAPVAEKEPRVVAEALLHGMAEDAKRRSNAPFMRDDGSVP